MLVAGWEYWGDKREVMRKSLSLRFFFCKQECSPSMSAAALPRFLESGIGGLGRKVRPISGSGSLLNGIVGFARSSRGIGVWRCTIPGPREDLVRIILRYLTSYAVLKERYSWADNTACSRRLLEEASIGNDYKSGTK